jgi:hypothetical protein
MGRIGRFMVIPSLNNRKELPIPSNPATSLKLVAFRPLLTAGLPFYLCNSKISTFF